jgi:hypothetical protein
MVDIGRFAMRVMQNSFQLKNYSWGRQMYFELKKPSH